MATTDIQKATLEEALKSLGSEDRKAAIRLVSDTLGISILKDIDNFSQQCGRLFAALPVLITKVIDDLETDVSALSTEECLAYSEKLLEIMHKNISLKQKIAQGKALFPSTVLSGEEQFIIDLMNSLETPEEKTKFIDALKQAMHVTKKETEENEEENESLPL